MRNLELEIIRLIRRLADSPPNRLVRIGIGDDTAVLKPPPASEELLLTSDQVIENTHFVRNFHPARAVGHQTAARALSDIAAMGGRPCYYVLSISVPAWAAGQWIRHYFTGLFRLCKPLGAALVGGDVARSERFSADLVMAGTAPRGEALLRSGAKPGDAVYVSGRLGGSALGLHRLIDQAKGVRDPAVKRHLNPQPRLELGTFLRENLRAAAAMDLSDGLSMDLGRLTRASAVGAEIDASSVPRFPGASLDQALHGGEDYELLFTVPASRRVPAEFQGLPLTRIGTIRAGRRLTLLNEGRRTPLRPEGFQHFQVEP